MCALLSSLQCINVAERIDNTLISETVSACSLFLVWSFEIQFIEFNHTVRCLTRKLLAVVFMCIQLHCSLDWVSMFVRVVMAPGCTLSTIAVAWSLLLEECIERVLPFVEVARYSGSYVHIVCMQSVKLVTKATLWLICAVNRMFGAYCAH